MANEYMLKQVVNGLENLATDNETLCEHLNLRAAFYGFPNRFEAASFSAPFPPYPSKEESQQRAAALMGRIADNSALALLSLGGQPASPDPVDADETELLRSILDWGTVQSSLYKVMVQLYGRRPAPAPGLPNPGASSEPQLWAEIVAWLEKIAADTDRLTMVQEIPVDGFEGTSGTEPDALVRLEQSVHRTTLNTLQVVGLLPQHLRGAAHAGQAARRKPAARRRRGR
jgi:hypothetical protein